MKAQNIRKLFTLHSWFGLATAWVLFVISFSGVVAVFAKGELAVWSQPERFLSYDIDGKRAEIMMEEYRAKVPEPYRHNVHIYPPSRSRHGQFVILYEAHDGDDVFDKEAVWAFHFDPVSYQLVDSINASTADYYGQYDTTMPSFLAGFHADLHLGNPIGLMITGAVGLLLLVSVVTGFFVHRQLIQQAFTMRWWRSIDICWRDFHKVMGVWGLAFNFLIGFTGAFLGLAAVALLPAAALVKFQGDTDKLIATFVEYPEPVLSNNYKVTPLDSILTDVKSRIGDGDVYSITILQPGDVNTDVYVEVGGGPGVVRQMMKYNAGDEMLQKSFSRSGDLEASSTPVLDLMSPLHFGQFGGLPVKLLWALLGLSSALLPLSGMLIWLYKRKSKNTSSGSINLLTDGYNTNLRLTFGVCIGLIYGTLATFITQTVLFNLGGSSLVNAQIGKIFFITWVSYLLVCFIPVKLDTLLRRSAEAMALTLLITAMSHFYYYPQQLTAWSNINMQISLGINFVLIGFAAFTLYMRCKGTFSTTSRYQQQQSEAVMEGK